MTLEEMFCDLYDKYGNDFNWYINTPEHIILEQMKKEALYQAISALPAADQALVQGLFFKGQSELDYAREIGVSQPAVHKRKVRILKSLKKLLEN